MDNSTACTTGLLGAISKEGWASWATSLVIAILIASMTAKFQGRRKVRRQRGNRPTVSVILCKRGEEPRRIPAVVIRED
ncbi:hypothetical protein BHE90_006962 [Fusarium euwallaceae]|uniref:Uncharacterized protein n=2 Tax=Fusarium solani species complex TaxID=232080 RepID=A0A430LS40_9HYPO|nr:hypothetical protein CDV31_010591 [Fusarium ambrosium]RTE78530.1 hypothetical protein BHE90_006962 [Fusarium euwallaceae]